MIPDCQEELDYTIYCSDCGDPACCREHAEQGCGYYEGFYWPLFDLPNAGHMFYIDPKTGNNPIGRGVTAQRHNIPQ